MSASTARLSPLFTWRSAIVDSMLPPTQKHVGLTLSLHMSERGDSCFPGVPRLARETGLAESTVRTALKELDSSGWVEREMRGGRGRTNRYTATVPENPPADGGLEAKPTGSADETHREESLNPPAAGGKDVSESVSNQDEAPSQSTRAANPIWDVLSEIFGEPLDRFKGHHGQVVKDVRELLIRDGVRDVELAKAEVRRRHQALLGSWGRSRATKDSLVRHWRMAGELADEGASGGLSPEQMFQQAEDHEREELGHD